MGVLSFLLLLLRVFGVAASVLWSSKPADPYNILSTSYPVGNGWLGALPFGTPGSETLNLNIDSLWSGGPFEYNNYTGNNPTHEVYSYLPGIRSFIFENGTGNVDPLLGNEFGYGSYQVLTNLTVLIDGVSLKTDSSYNRTLDLSNGIHTTKFTGIDGHIYTTTVYCSNPDSVCIYDLSSSGKLPNITIGYSNNLVATNLTNYTCGAAFTRLSGVTQLGPPLGMKYDTIAGVSGSLKTTCNEKTGQLVISSGNGQTKLTIVISAGTDYDMKMGTAAANYSFRGQDPAGQVEQNVALALKKPESTIRDDHIKDFEAWIGEFTLDLPDTAHSAGFEAEALFKRYNVTVPQDPYLEKLLFDFGRYLFLSSCREGTLPPNLQGIWAVDTSNPWSADYHLDINLQMNQWGVVQTGLGDLQGPLWDMMQYVWVPRGTQTAQLLYNGEGWVAHDEINTFGHTGMKEDASWADYPIAPAWMMQHVWDYFEYSHNLTFWQTQGYPLLKGVAQFWLSQLQEDKFFNDSTLVVNPCNSAEHGPTTFACTHYQQLIFQVFESVLSGAEDAKDTDAHFLQQVKSTLSRLDTGLHIGTWGEIKEWKLPDSYGYDVQNDTHRHLSHLVGWHPGWSLSSFAGGYSNKTIQDAVTVSLLDRGVGIADSDAGWEKVWRSACRARLNSSEDAYFELRLAISHNIAYNGLSMYVGTAYTNGGPPTTPFQIDANFGLVGAALSMLVVDLPVLHDYQGVRTVVLGPAIPAAWGNGSVKGMRLRGGGSVDFSWDGKGVVTKATTHGAHKNVRLVDVHGNRLA